MARTLATRRPKAYRTRRAFKKKTFKVSIPRLRRVLQQVPELKYYDGSFVFSPVATTWATFQSFLNPILNSAAAATSGSASVRIGNKIFVKHITVRMLMQPTLLSTQTSGNRCRCAIVHGKQMNGATLTPADVWNGTSINVLRNTPMMPKADVLYDRDMIIAPMATNAAAVSAVGCVQSHKFFIKVNRVIDYAASNGTASDMLKDDYLISCVADVAATCTMGVYWKVIFYDN